jgi:broad specificity phosphatase PhoE
MGKLTIIRHAPANYPHDELTSDGLELAYGSRERFSGYTKVICSPLKRSQQTAQALGYDKLIIDERLKEFEVDINAPTAADYIREIHIRFIQELTEYGNKLLEAIKHYGNEDCLIVSHNAIMSACLYLLIGDNNPFDNLTGFEIEVENNITKNPTRISLK